MNRILLFCGVVTAITLSLNADEPERVAPGVHLEGEYSFAEVIHSTTGYNIVHFLPSNSEHAELLSKLERIAMSAARVARRDGIRKSRANEVGNAMEELVLQAMKEGELRADRPKAKSGRRRSVGYPDFELENEPACYLELKTYSATAANSTQRTFYYSPSDDPKITRDSLHLLLAFRMVRTMENGESIWRPERFQITSLHDVPVKLKLEYNQGNRTLYDKKYLLLDRPVE